MEKHRYDFTPHVKIMWSSINKIVVSLILFLNFLQYLYFFTVIFCFCSNECERRRRRYTSKCSRPDCICTKFVGTDGKSSPLFFNSFSLSRSFHHFQITLFELIGLFFFCQLTLYSKISFNFQKNCVIYFNSNNNNNNYKKFSNQGFNKWVKR